MEGTSLTRQMVHPTLLVAELEALKNGILTAIQCNIKVLKVFTSSNIVVSLALNGQPLDTFHSSLKVMRLITEIHEIILFFTSFEIELIFTSLAIEDLQIMMNNSITLFQNMKRVL